MNCARDDKPAEPWKYTMKDITLHHLLLIIPVMLQLHVWADFTQASGTEASSNYGIEMIQYDEDDTMSGDQYQNDGYMSDEYPVSEPEQPEEMAEPDLTGQLPEGDEAYYQDEEMPVYNERGEEVLSGPVDPLVDEPYPLVEQPAPLVDTPDPLVPRPAPLVEQPYPLVDQGPPLVDHTAPLIRQSAPLVRHTSPLVNQPAPLVRQPSPLVNQPAPLVRQPSPLVSRPAPLVR